MQNGIEGEFVVNGNPKFQAELASLVTKYKREVVAEVGMSTFEDDVNMLIELGRVSGLLLGAIASARNLSEEERKNWSEAAHKMFDAELQNFSAAIQKG